MSIKGTWCKNLRDQFLVEGTPGSIRTLGVNFEPLPEEDPKPLYRVMVSLGPGMDYGCLLNAEEAEDALKKLVADGWVKMPEEERT